MLNTAVYSSPAFGSSANENSYTAISPSDDRVASGSEHSDSISQQSRRLPSMTLNVIATRGENRLYCATINELFLTSESFAAKAVHARLPQSAPEQTTSTARPVDINALPEAVLARVFNHMPLQTLQRLAYVCKLWANVQTIIIANREFCICDEIYCNDGKFSFGFVLSVPDHYQDPEWRVNICNNGQDLLKSIYADRVTELKVVCPENVIDWTKIDGVARDTYQILKQFRSLSTITIMNMEAFVLYMPAGRLTIRAIFPSLTKMYWRYKNDEYEVRVTCEAQSNYVPIAEVLYFKEETWTSSQAFDHIQTYIEILKADAIANIGSCSNTIAARIFGVLMPFSPFNLKTRSCRATDIFAIIKELSITINDQQNLQQTLSYLTSLETLTLEDKGKCSCVLKVPNMPTVKRLILKVHSSVLDRYFFSNFPNLVTSEIYSENCGDVWLEHLSMNMPAMPKLRYLKLDCFDDGYFMCPQEVDSVICAAMEKATSLRVLHQGKGCQPTIAGLKRLLKHPTMQRLTCRPSADASVRTVLRTLVQSLFCSTVEVVCLTAPVRKAELMQHLNELKLPGCFKQLSLSPSSSTTTGAQNIPSNQTSVISYATAAGLDCLPPKKRLCVSLGNPSEYEDRQVLTKQTSTTPSEQFYVRIQEVNGSLEDDIMPDMAEEASPMDDVDEFEADEFSASTPTSSRRSKAKQSEIWISWTDRDIMFNEVIANNADSAESTSQHAIDSYGQSSSNIIESGSAPQPRTHAYNAKHWIRYPLLE